MSTFNVGAICFGVVIGWITYRTLRRSDTTSVSDLAGVVGAVGGAAVLAIFNRGDSFAWYAIGLAGGFFLYLIVNLILDFGGTTKWMGGDDFRAGDNTLS
jgi:hypothetical protein